MVAVKVQARICAPDKADGIDSEMTYQVFGSGEIAISNQVIINERLPFVPRVGVEVILPETFERLAWFGRGPHENYADRKHGAAVGLYHSTVTEQFTPYVYPSESGGKEDVRWLALTGEDGSGLLITGLEPFHIDALHYTIDNIAGAKHLYALEPVKEVILHLDGRHMGVGGDDGWWALVHNEFLIFPGIYHFAFSFKPKR
jgi:beta-galactosidase